MINVENLTAKDKFRNAVLKASEEEKVFFAITVRMEGYPQNEVIINRTDNFLPKLDYWCDIYDENLVNKRASIISIVGFTAADNYQEIQKILD